MDFFLNNMIRRQWKEGINQYTPNPSVHLWLQPIFFIDIFAMYSDAEENNS